MVGDGAMIIYKTVISLYATYVCTVTLQTEHRVDMNEGSKYIRGILALEEGGGAVSGATALTLVAHTKMERSLIREV